MSDNEPEDMEWHKAILIGTLKEMDWEQLPYHLIDRITTIVALHKVRQQKTMKITNITTLPDGCIQVDFEEE